MKSYALERSIAVLPFLNMSADPENEYFSDGMTEEIINSLSKIPGLKVTARTSAFALKGTNLDVREIGEKLGVKLILEGSVRKAANQVRINIQLVTVENGFRIWAKKYDRKMVDIFAVQDEIASSVLEQLKLELEANFTSNNYTQNTEAYEMLLKGTYFFKRDYDGTVKALDYFQKAVELDPSYAEAYAYIGEVLIHHAAFGLISSIDAHERARSAAYTALGINRYEPLAYKVLAFIQLFYDWQWEAALESYEKAVRYGLPEQNDFISYYYIFLQNDFDKAIQVAKNVLESDPIHAESHWQLGLCYYFARKFKEAVSAFDQAIALEKSYSEAYHWKSTALGFLKQFDQAEEAAEKAISLSEDNPWAHLSYLILKIQLGKKDEVLATLQNRAFQDPMDPAMLYSLLGMIDEAIEFLEKGYEAKSVMMVTLKHYWIWDPIRSDPRFEMMCERMNFSDSTLVFENADNTITQLLSGERPKKQAEPDAETLEVLERLKVLMEEEEMYLNPSLSLRELAESLEIHPNKLSWLINESLEQNFNEYLNGLRLQYFQQQAIDPRNSHYTLLGLAYESGFNSKSVFNAFFKKSTGLTPRAWLKSREN
jgi:TolB-like protein/AraC-like DNA-binding protein